VALLIKIKDKSLELIRYREMFMGLVNREIRARYKGSALGFLWSLLNPLMMMGIYSLIFSVYMRIDMPNYAVFLFCGILPWGWFSTALTNASAAIVANSSLIKKIYFPLEVLPLVNVTTNLINFLLSLPILLLSMLVTQTPITPFLLLLPVLVVIQFVLTLGFALILCTLNTFYRDVEQLLGPLIMAWFYMTPVIYPAAAVPEKLKFLLLVNPVAPLMLSYQDIIYHGRMPSLTMLAYCLVVGIVLFVVGYTLFYRKKFTFAEVV